MRYRLFLQRYVELSLCLVLRSLDFANVYSTSAADYFGAYLLERIESNVRIHTYNSLSQGIINH